MSIKISDWVRNLDKATYQRKLNHGIVYCKDACLGQDAVQSALVKLFLSDTVVDHPESFSGRAIMNVAMNDTRDNRPHRRVESIDAFVDDSWQPSYTPDYVLDEQTMLLYEALPKLKSSPTQYKVMMLFLADIDMKDIAIQLNMPYDTVKANYRHGMLKLKDWITNANN